MAKLKFIN